MLIAHVVLGPIGWEIGSWISNVVYSGLTSGFGWLFAAVFGFSYAPLVITGLHHMTNAIDLQLMSEFDGTILWPMIALSNIAQGSAVVAIIYLNRKDKKEQQVSVPAAISCYLGVTEPAMFGINLRYLFPFFCRNDWLLHCGDYLCRLWCYGKFHWCRWNPRYTVDPGSRYANVCSCNDYCDCRSIYPDSCNGKNENRKGCLRAPREILKK